MNKRVILGMILSASLGASAVEPTFDHGSVFTLIEENDLFVKTDRHYTQGIKLSYMHGDDVLPLGSQWMYDHLPQVGFETVVGRLGYSVGQNIYTPSDIETTALQRDDRPYAGWLYLGAILQRRGWSLGHRLTEEDIEIEAGVIGEWALAGEAQTWVHQWRGFHLPRGWKYQIHNEPGGRIKYQRTVRLLSYESGGFGADLSPHLGTSLGNVDISFRGGAIIRLGYNLPDDFGYHTIDSLATTSGGRSRSQPINWGAYVFGGAEGRWVLFNETLEGGLMNPSHSVQPRRAVGDTLVGFAVQVNWVEFGYAHTFRSPEFRDQKQHDSFGSVFLKARF